ncbi:unnamed protein product [Peniophora sp. CBMAI 1063]|nr:unnamed protein product [Peniophora sp. CBMAI 1063]
MQWRSFLLNVFLLGSTCLRSAKAQEFTVNSSWTNSHTIDGRGDREALANGAAQALVQRLGGNGNLNVSVNSQALASMYSNLALQDRLSGNQTWKEAVTTGMGTWAAQNDIFTNGTAGSLRTTTNAAQWGLAFAYAYEAYNDTSFLTLAQNAFDAIYPYFVTSEDAESYHAPANRTFQYNITNGVCLSRAAGAIWWLPDVHDDDWVHTDSVGPFAVLAAHLYQVSQNETYKTVGMLSTSFLGTGAIWNTDYPYNIFVEVEIYKCGHWSDPSPGPQGWMIHALAVWGNITNDAAITSRLRDVVSAATQNPVWTQIDGTLIDPPTGNGNGSDNSWDDKAIFIRSLSETSRRFPTWTDVAGYIQGFINVQYNQLISKARTGSESNAYSTLIYGPPPTSFETNGNIFALDVLNAAFDALPKSNNAVLPAPTSSGAPPATTSTQDTHDNASNAGASHMGAIVGGAVGGACVAVLSALLLLYRRHRVRRRMAIADGEVNESEAEHNASRTLEVANIEPYIMRVSRAPRAKGESPFVGTGGRDRPEYSSSTRDAEPASGSAIETPGSTEEEWRDGDVLTVSTFRRLFNSMVQEHSEGSAPPAYGSDSA